LRERLKEGYFSLKKKEKSEKKIGVGIFGGGRGAWEICRKKGNYS